MRRGWEAITPTNFLRARQPEQPRTGPRTSTSIEITRLSIYSIYTGGAGLTGVSRDLLAVSLLQPSGVEAPYTAVVLAVERVCEGEKNMA